MDDKNASGHTPFTFRVSEDLTGVRLSRALALRIPGLSVRGAKALTDLGRVFVDDRRVLKASGPLKGGERVELHRDRSDTPPLLCREDLVWTGSSLVAVNKPPGLLVYGTRGIAEGTVVPQLERVLRKSGQWETGDRLLLVHRLDRDTSGLMLVARHAGAARSLEEQFRRHQVEKRYLALVLGSPARENLRVSSPVLARRHPGDLEEPVPGGKAPASRALIARAALPGKGRARKSRRGPGSRETGTRKAGLNLPSPDAVTEFRVLESFAGCSLVEARPAGGRTHQIRVHLAKLGHPVLGDMLYGPQKLDDPVMRAIPRQMLHAASLGFVDPDTGGWLRFEAPTAPDMLRILKELRKGKGL